jgi:hypothetical protein
VDSSEHTVAYTGGHVEETIDNRVIGDDQAEDRAGAAMDGVPDRSSVALQASITRSSTQQSYCAMIRHCSSYGVPFRDLIGKSDSLLSFRPNDEKADPQVPCSRNSSAKGSRYFLAFLPGSVSQGMPGLVQEQVAGLAA